MAWVHYTSLAVNRIKFSSTLESASSGSKFVSPGTCRIVWSSLRHFKPYFYSERRNETDVCTASVSFTYTAPWTSVSACDGCNGASPILSWHSLHKTVFNVWCKRSGFQSRHADQRFTCAALHVAPRPWTALIYPSLSLSSWRTHLARVWPSARAANHPAAGSSGYKTFCVKSVPESQAPGA